MPASQGSHKSAGVGLQQQPIPEARNARKNGRRPTLPRSLPRSTIGAGGLNFSVRNGKRCIPAAIVTLAKKRQVFCCKGCLPFENRTARTVKSTSSPRLISTTRLHTSLHLHLWPINLVVYQESYSLYGDGRSHLEASFPLRCFQRLSLPYIATRRCPWQDNRYTRGTSTPVLSY
jgi:hypothetical protein